MKTPARKARNAPTPKGNRLRKLGKKWLDRVESAGKSEKRWLDDARKAVEAFTNESPSDAYADHVQAPAGYDFNILFSNVETIVPAVINSSPVPDIRRRFQDDDPAARVVSDILERAIRVQIDDSRLQTELEAVAQDAFLAGRGVPRIRFFSDFVPVLPTKEELKDAQDANEGHPAPDTAGDGEESGYLGGEGGQTDDGSGVEGDAAPAERVENERIRFEAVSWVDYRHGPAKRWEERPWDAFRFCIEREDENKSFDAGLIGEQFSDTDWNARKKEKGELCGWEIWDKESRKVIFIDDTGTVLKEVDDPLGLTEFFCIPVPIQPIAINGRLMPVNPFSIYRSLANKLDDAVRRKSKLIDAMRAKGWYMSSEKDMQAIVDLNDNEFAPIADPEIVAQLGGIDKALAFWPFEKFIAAIQQLDGAIEQYKQWIYEITGISDIVRGASVASETATAQNIKSQWGSLRIQKMQRLMERCARDLFVMMSEIIPSKFSYRTLEEMTGIPINVLPTDTPEQVEQKLKVQALLKRKLASYYRIDVESDSTVRADLTRQKQEIAEFLQSASSYFSAVAPLVQQGALPAEAAVEIFAATARMFNLGKSVEDTLEKMVAEAKAKAEQAANAPPHQGQGPSPEQMEAQARMQEQEADLAARQQDMQMKTAEFQAEMQALEQETMAKLAEASQKAHADERKSLADAALAEFNRSIKEVELSIKNVELEMKNTDLAIKQEELRIKRTPEPAATAEVTIDA